MVFFMVILGIIGSGYFCATRFEPEICELAKLLVPSTRTLWQMTKVLIVFDLYILLKI